MKKGLVEGRGGRRRVEEEEENKQRKRERRGVCSECHYKHSTSPVTQ